MSISRRQKRRLDAQLEVMLEHCPDTDQAITVLDLGTEYGLTGEWIRKIYSNAVLHGVEIHKPTYEECRRKKIYSMLYCEDALDFLKRSVYFYDVVIAAEIIEHLEKPDGIELLNQVKHRGKLAIVTSPLGWMAQGELYGNPYQVHKSAWDLEDFNIRGWKEHFTSKQHHLGVYWTKS